MELLRITRQIHCKAVEQRATLIQRQYNRDWGTSYSRPPIDEYLTSPPLQNPGGASDGSSLLLTSPTCFQSRNESKKIRQCVNCSRVATGHGHVQSPIYKTSVSVRGHQPLALHVTSFRCLTMPVCGSATMTLKRLQKNQKDCVSQCDCDRILGPLYLACNDGFV